MENKSNNKFNSSPLPKIEEGVLNFWDKTEIFKKTLERKAPEGDFVFYDGPPFATGEPHYGHIVASIMKDAVPRYFTMKGYRVERRWGWDCHGLPVENLAEKELGLKNKQDIEKMGVAKFNDYCKSIVLRYAEEWKKTIHRVGRWVDMEHDYKTMEPDYMETIWWIFKNLWDKKLVYKGYKAMHICPRCGTTLSNFEVTQNYKDIKDLSATVKFELEDEPGTYVLAWTTTPWTLIGNVALAVGEDVKYVKIKFTKGEFKNKTFIFAMDRQKDVLKDAHVIGSELPIKDSEPGEIIGTLKGRDLVGKKYKPLFDYYSNEEKLENKENGWKIYAGDFVTTDEGTGIVHIAPAFGEDDMKLGQENNLPFIQHVDGFGRFKNEVKDWPGEDVKPLGDPKKTDEKIIDELKKQGKLFTSQKYEHSYPHCWRCETPLLNYATDSWFVKVTDIRNDLVKNNQKIKWMPEHIKDGRFGKWLEQARDWAISRNRYWGATLPVWVCDKCEEKIVVGSREELKKYSGQEINDLHKQYVDEIIWDCKCGGKMKRIPEVFDCWFESGSMPYAQDHYPFAGKKYKKDSPVPADFIAEGIDQTRGWFYTLLVLSTALFKKEMAKNIIANGIVLAEDGQKMSKRLKNYPDPSYIFDKYGVDAMRYYLFASPVMKADNINFSEKDLAEQTRFFNILLNVLSFYKMFASEVEISDLEEKDLVNVLDIWINSRLEQTKEIITKKMNNYDLHAVREIPVFINDLSTWYVRRSRDRLKGENMEDKMRALKTLRHVLYNLVRIMAPFLPFTAEYIYRELGADVESVHLKEWPNKKDQIAKVNEKVLADMEKVRKIAELGLAARDQVGIKVRQVLNELRVENCELKEEYEILIKEELNVKNVKIKKGAGEIKVELDANITDDLKLEGLKREIVRQVNVMRKNAKLTIKDKIILSWQSDSELVKKVFAQMVEELKKDTLSQEIKEGEAVEEVKVNGEMVRLGIEKI